MTQPWSTPNVPLLFCRPVSQRWKEKLKKKVTRKKTKTLIYKQKNVPKKIKIWQVFGLCWQIIMLCYRGRSAFRSTSWLKSWRFQGFDQDTKVNNHQLFRLRKTLSVQISDANVEESAQFTLFHFFICCHVGEHMVKGTSTLLRPGLVALRQTDMNDI